MPIFSKRDKPKARSASTSLNKSGIAFPNFSAAQKMNSSFILVGTIHFNPGKLQFDEGYFRFGLKSGRVVAEARGCYFDYPSIAYRDRQDEVSSTQVRTETSRRNEKQKQGSIEGGAGLDLAKGIGARVKADGSLSRTSVTAKKRSETSDRETTKQLTEAFPRQFKGKRVYTVEWVIRHSDENPYWEGDNVFDMLHGERLRGANQEAGLAQVHLTKPDGRVHMRLEVEKNDFVPVEITFDEGTKLHRYGKEIMSKRTKKAVIGRMAVADAFAGSLKLQKLPE